MKTRFLVAAVVVAVAAQAPADSYTWTWDAQAASWHAQRKFTTEPHDNFVNNFGLTGNPTPFPGSTDDVTIGAAHPTYGTPTLTADGATVHDLGVTGNLLVTGGKTLTTNGSFTNTGQTWVHDGTLALTGTAANTQTIDVHVGGWMRIYGTSLANDGLIALHVNTGMGEGRIAVGTAGLVISGSGNIALGTELGGLAFTNAADHTIHLGAIEQRNGASITAPMANLGTIDADQSAKTLVLSGSAKTNDGTMEATNGGRLEIWCPVTQTAAGVVAANGGNVGLRGGSITGGSLRSTGTSLCETVSSTTTTLADVVNEAAVMIWNNGSILALAGSGITNHGTIESTENTGMGAGTLRIDADLTLGGTGAVHCRTRLYSANGSTLTQAAGHTIRYGDSASGEGQIEVALVNHGVVSADYSGKTISLRSATKTNDGTMEATNGGRLEIWCPVTQTAAGVIAANGGNVGLRGGSITGGSLRSTGASLCETVSSTTTTLADAVNEAAIIIWNNGSILALAGSGITNHGTIESTENTGMGAGTLRIDADLALSGTGAVHCRTRLYSANGSTLTQAAGHTIRYGDSASGEGQIEVGLVNHGVVRADYSGRTISLRSAAKTNDGKMEATNGGRLEIWCPVTQTAAGVIAANGGNVGLRGGTIAGGSFRSTGASVVESVSNTTTTVEGIENRATVHLWANNSVLAVRGTVVNHGTIELHPNTGMGAGRIRLDSAATFAGSGSVACNAEIFSTVGAGLANESGHTLKGRGTVSVAVDNRGTVESDQSGRTFNLSGGAAQFSGTTLTGGTWVARAGATLAVAGAPNVTVNQGEVVLEGAGSTIAWINLLADNQGGFRIAAGRNFTTAGTLANSGLLDVGSGSTLAVPGNLQATGAATTRVEIAGPPADPATWGHFAATGTASLGGSLQVFFSRTATYADGDRWHFLNATGERSGQFAALHFFNVPAGMMASVEYVADGVDVLLRTSVPPDSYADWLAQQDFQHPGDDAPDADPDGDGFPNLVEYGLDLNPAVADLPADNIRGRRSGGTLWLFVNMPEPARGDLQYTVRGTADLVSWYDIAGRKGSGPWAWLAGAPERIVALEAVPGRNPVEVGIPQAHEADDAAFLSLWVTLVE